jgi:PAS domain S-box-containing protein
LNAAYEQLTATEEELRGQYEELSLNEQRIRESEKRYRTLFDNTTDEVYTHDMQPDGVPGNFLEVNDIMCSKLGYTREELLTMTVRDIVSETHRKKMAEIWQQFKGTGVSTFYGEHKRKDGSVFPVEISIRNISLSGREIVLAAARDVTERKRAEEVLRQANNKLNVLNGIIQHNEINTMAGLLGMIDMAKDPSYRIETESLLNEIKKLAETIHRQIEFSRDYQATGVMEPQWQPLRDTINRAIKPFAGSGISISNDISGIEAYADPFFEKVFINLIRNSISNGQRVTTIRFTKDQLNNGLSIIYEDNGAGISTDRKKKIFELGIGQHSGMELFLAKEILALTGITICETGEPGKGARFEITVPKGGYRISDNL